MFDLGQKVPFLVQFWLVMFFRIEHSLSVRMAYFWKLESLFQGWRAKEKLLDNFGHNIIFHLTYVRLGILRN